jgi:uncharacterized membrane protein
MAVRAEAAGSPVVRRLAPPIHPALVRNTGERRTSLQLRAADRITTFSGSMPFVYIHVVWFVVWVALNKGWFGKGLIFDAFPFGLLTMIVSLEAIFLSTFVMISQNRADEKRQALADHQWELIQEEDKQNQELLDLSRQILELTRAVHGAVGGSKGSSGR